MLGVQARAVRSAATAASVGQNCSAANSGNKTNATYERSEARQSSICWTFGAGGCRLKAIEALPQFIGEP
jgi:hypothetical protein